MFIFRKKNRTNKPFLQRLENGLSVLQKYFTLLEHSPYYLSAWVLHPSRRTNCISTALPQSSQAPVLEKIKNLWIGYRNNLSTCPKLYEKFCCTTSHQENLNLFDQIKFNRKNQYGFQIDQDKYENYIHQDSDDIEKQSPLE